MPVRHLLLSVLIFLFCGSKLEVSLYGQTEASPHRETDDNDESVVIDDSTFQPLDVFELEYASDSQVSPDGSIIVYARNHFDIMKDSRASELWMIDSRGQHLPLLSCQPHLPILANSQVEVDYSLSVRGLAQRDHQTPHSVRCQNLL